MIHYDDFHNMMRSIHILKATFYIQIDTTHWTSTRWRSLQDIGRRSWAMWEIATWRAWSSCTSQLPWNMPIVVFFFFLSWEYAALLCRSRVLKTYFQIRNWIYDIYLHHPKTHTNTTNQPVWNWFQPPTPPLDGKGIFLHKARRDHPWVQWVGVSLLATSALATGTRRHQGTPLAATDGFFRHFVGARPRVETVAVDFGNCEEILIPAHRIPPMVTTYED